MIVKPITLQHEPLFWLGDKFYKVEQSVKAFYKNSKIVLYSKCPSCNDTRIITYKGFNGNDFECECPVCRGDNYHGYGNRIELTNWEVHEYIVYKIRAQGPETMSAYKDGIGYVDSLVLTAFCKTGRCMDDYIQADIPYSNKYVDRSIESIDTGAYFFKSEEYIFRKKADATKLLEALRERDKHRLSEFNELYETDYQYPF